MRVLPNMVVLVPADAPETAEAVRAMVDYSGPVYMRLGRTPVPVIYDEPYTFDNQQLQFQIGRSIELASGNDVTIISNGLMVAEALNAAEALKTEDIQVRVLNMHTIKPLDVQAICKAARETGAIVTAEEHSIIGGLGSAVSEVVVQNYPVPMECVGVNDIFTESGTDNELLQIYDLTAAKLISTVRTVMQRK
jgi:transketolase